VDEFGLYLRALLRHVFTEITRSDLCFRMMILVPVGRLISGSEIRSKRVARSQPSPLACPQVGEGMDQSSAQLDSKGI